MGSESGNVDASVAARAPALVGAALTALAVASIAVLNLPQCTSIRYHKYTSLVIVNRTEECDGERREPWGRDLQKKVRLMRP
jgi:hypothetical protein